MPEVRFYCNGSDLSKIVRVELILNIEHFNTGNNINRCLYPLIKYKIQFYI